MANGITKDQFSEKEIERNDQFEHVWTDQLDLVFKDVAPYYDSANYIASLGLWGYFKRSFLSIIQLKEQQQALDVCAGTNAVGIAMLEKEPTLAVTAIDRSPHMQVVGQRRAREAGFNIDSTLGDVHHLPFPDASFDVVTLQFASRHLRVMQVFKEIHRVLKPGGHFYHSDMLRPANPLIAKLYFAYLKICLTTTALVFNSSEAALNCRKYFVETLSMFYSAAELSKLMESVGFQQVECKTIFAGMLGFHRGIK
jgi:demethylmenaquinone methyltransferase/2-methoxy-6-polyprenyl-1,4-benzoquinol methylase